MRDFSVRPRNKRAFVWRTDEDNAGLTIFVHGFNGGFLSTWGEFPQLLQSDADSDGILREWDYLFIGYRTLGFGGVDAFGQIATLIGTQINLALEGLLPNRHGVPYTRIAVVGHSLGTLGIRELVASPLQCPYPAFGRIQKLGLIGTPLDGSVLAYLAQWVAPIGTALCPDSSELVALKQATTGAWINRPWAPPLIQLGMHDLVVGAPFIQWPGDVVPPGMVSAGHSAICKPRDFQDDPVVFLRSVLK